MKTHYSWFEVENAKNDISQKYQYLLKQQDKTIYSYITENSELRQEIKNLKQIIKNLKSKGNQNGGTNDIYRCI